MKMGPNFCLQYIRRSIVCKQSLWHSQVNYGTIAAKKRVCVVGAGPAGFYASQYILKTLDDCVVDMVEKLPVPFGLVRYGVAPDHPEVKNVINTFSKVAENPRFRFYGNLCLGKDVSLAELRESYHAVLLTYGADKDRQLGIPNEEQKHVLSARMFVAWYNGLPGAENLNPNLEGSTVTIVGQGNVAVDVARMLLTNVNELKKTDTTDYALDALSRSTIQKVYLVGRRGPLQAAFTIKELREILKLPNVQTLWRPQDFVGVQDELSKLQRPRKRLTELMLKSLTEQAVIGSNKEKQFLPVFLRAPSKVEEKALQFTITELQNDKAIPTTDIETLPADLILRSIGYKSMCVDKDLCFNERGGFVHNVGGRVIKDIDSNTFEEGLYVAGWLGTGPTGVILTTMNWSFAVAKTICDDILSNRINSNIPKSGIDIKNKRIVTWSGWKSIDDVETKAGHAKGKPREKIINIEEMLKIAGV